VWLHGGGRDAHALSSARWRSAVEAGKFKYLPSLPDALGHLPLLVSQLYICYLNSRQCYIFVILDEVAK
jgi:hypothetical protein